MVHLRHGHSTQLELESSQCHCLAEDPSIPLSTMEYSLHRNHNHCAAVLDSRDLRKLHIVRNRLMFSKISANMPSSFNNINNLFVHTRPYEAIFRDPWWIISIIILMYSIHSTYKLPFTTIVGLSPRFGILFAAMILSIIFIILDILAVTTHIFSTRLPDGLSK